MKSIGGNTIAVIQTATVERNAIGETVPIWTDAQRLFGWLDLSGGDARYTSYNAKIQESTHIFICDYVPLADGIEAETARMLIRGRVYDITLIDNPMELGSGSHWEIFLKYTGGQ